MNYEEFKERLSEDLKQGLYERTGNEHYIDTTNVSKNYTEGRILAHVTKDNKVFI